MTINPYPQTFQTAMIHTYKQWHIGKLSMRWLAIVHTCKWLQSKNKIWDDLQSFTRTNDCTPKKVLKKHGLQLFIHVNDCSPKKKMRWLAIVRTYKRLHIWLEIFCMCGQFHSTNSKKNMMACNHSYMWTIAVQKFKTNMACNRSYVWMIAVQKKYMRWLAIVRTYKQLHSKN